VNNPKLIAMKKLFQIIVTLLFLLQMSSVKASDSLAYSYQNISVGLHSSRFDIRVHFTYNIKRHQIGAGMVIRKPQQYYWNEGPGWYSYSTGPSQKGISINGANLFYRFYPIKPKESFDFYFENYLGLIHDRVDYNGVFYQRNYNLTEAIHISMRYKFLQRFSTYMGFGPGLSYAFGKDKEAIPLYFPDFEEYPQFNVHLNLVFGFEIGLK
jgi:hypothetical protein